MPARHGFVVLCFPAVTCNRASKIVLKDFAIKEDHARDLSVHGTLDLSNPRLRFAFGLPFPLAAIHLVDAKDSRVEGVSVVGWLSDGISLQRGANDTVVNCLVEKCAGKGLHAGGGLHGIHMWDGDNNTVTDNTVSNNSQSAPGRFSGIWLGKSALSVVQGNRCFNDQPTKTQKHGIEELADCRENRIAENQCHGHAQKDVVLAAEQPAGPPDATPRRGRARRPSVQERVQ